MRVCVLTIFAYIIALLTTHNTSIQFIPFIPAVLLSYADCGLEATRSTRELLLSNNQFHCNALNTDL